MTTILLVVHLMVAVAMIVLVLLQRSEGGALGIGGGGDGMMSARGLGNAMTRATAVTRRVALPTARLSGRLAAPRSRRRRLRSFACSRLATACG